MKTEKAASCAVCRRPGCQLQSHKTYLPYRRRETKEIIKSEETTLKAAQLKPSSASYSSSYAFTRNVPSATPHGISAGRLDGFHELPIPEGHRSELHHAVYSGASRLSSPHVM